MNSPGTKKDLKFLAKLNTGAKNYHKNNGISIDSGNSSLTVVQDHDLIILKETRNKVKKHLKSFRKKGGALSPLSEQKIIHPLSRQSQRKAVVRDYHSCNDSDS